MKVAVEILGQWDYCVTMGQDDLKVLYEIAHRMGMKSNLLLALAIERGLNEFETEQREKE